MDILYEYEQNISHLKVVRWVQMAWCWEKQHVQQTTTQYPKWSENAGRLDGSDDIKFHRDKHKIQLRPSKSTVQAQIRSRRMHEQNWGFKSRVSSVFINLWIHKCNHSSIMQGRHYSVFWEYNSNCDRAVPKIFWSIFFLSLATISPYTNYRIPFPSRCPSVKKHLHQTRYLEIMPQENG